MTESPFTQSAGPATHHAVMAQARAENFPVASVFLPRTQRRQLMAIYGVARLIDDVGDEAPGNRQELLDWLDAELDRVFRGSTPEHPTMRALAAAVRSSPLPEAPFRALVKANRQDQVVTRYETFDQLLGYCRLSAAPVGELVLHVFEAATPDQMALSEPICAGLQVVEHIQDVTEDYSRGRIYMPLEDMARFGCGEADLAGPGASERLRALLAFEAAQAARLLDSGAPLATTLALRPRIAVACFVAGGRAALHELAGASYDVGFGPPAKRRRGAFVRAFARAVTGR
jgi:squalene synthase HpnC